MITQRICILILCFFLTGFSKDQIKTVKIDNPYAKKKFLSLVVLPDNYRKDKKRYPVIYLLHGYSGNYQSFQSAFDMVHYSDSLQVIFVCPDGDFNSWYLNSPAIEGSQYASYFINHIIPFIDKEYRTISQAKARAIIGSSMGGHGALTLLAKFPDLFYGGSSISGILDLTKFPRQWDMARVLGFYKANKKLWEKHSFFYIVNTLAGKNKKIIIDCGTFDFALAVNRSVHKKMDSLAIAHEYFERSGGHSFAYVKKVITFHVSVFATLMHENIK